MPLYEYQCESCGVRFEVIQKFSDAPVDTCRNCGGKVQRLLSAPAIQFKGSGWYITDYAKKGGGEEKPPTPPASATGASSSAGTGAGSKPAGSDSGSGAASASSPGGADNKT
jgi:putative FmdB family regulatory protein